MNHGIMAKPAALQDPATHPYPTIYHISYIIMKIYTKSGDSGRTSIQGGERLSKADERIRAYGALDEANTILGQVCHIIQDTRMIVELQRYLFVAGADLSNPDMTDDAMRITESMTRRLEEWIDHTDATLEPLNAFILPGGGAAGSSLHHARTVVRRAETHMAAITGPTNPECMRFVNRLSDLLFVMARAANRDEGIADIRWK